MTVANTRERQEALAAAHTHGRKFFVTGGEHVTLNDMLIVAELNQRKAEATGRGEGEGYEESGGVSREG